MYEWGSDLQISYSADSETMVSFVVPVYNMERTIEKCLQSITDQNFPEDKFEIIVVDDASTDNSFSIARNVLQKSEIKHRITSNSRNLKIPCTSNIALEMSAGRFIGYVDSDVVLERDWLKKTLSEMKDEKVGAVAGFIKTGNPEIFWSKLAGYELEWRYDQLKSKFVDHVSTTNTLYRREALESIKENGTYFDERFYYGLDSDMSNRLRTKGWKLIQTDEAYCLHYGKQTFKDYFKMCRNTAYARLLLIQKYKKIVFDRITSFEMMLQIPLLGLVLFFCLMGVLTYSFSFMLSRFSFLASAMMLFILLLMQVPRALWVLRVKKDVSLAFLFPILLQIRNVAALYTVLVYTYHGALSTYNRNQE
jgi:cellulose synthase/poly-beta-1,6-N-acetylglucosamine synthase-like glycosyltransferase